jgi:very-short-patch-repair endonuclease
MEERPSKWPSVKKLSTGEPMDRRASRVNPRLLTFARTLRRSQTPAEHVLWQCLRDRRLNGFKFRRQVPIGDHVADFYCAECRLIVEADGASHDGRYARDEQRTADLNARGYVVVRCQNAEIHADLEGVLLAILEECENSAPERSASGPGSGERR